MATAVTTGAQPARPTSRPYLALGLTFLLLGVGFAFPLRLVSHPPANIWEGNISPQALNLYALTAFAGWSHFIYAWRGQWMGSRKLSRRNRAFYWACVLGLLVVLAGLRALLGVAVFSLAAWVYNIAHFIKAESHFSGKYETRTAFYSPVAAFAWFTVCIFHVGPLANVNVVFVGTVLIGASVLVFGGWRLLADGDVRLPLLTLFLLGETMVWARYDPSEAFRVGVYIFHIAAASFYHYLTAYAYAESSPARQHDKLLSPLAILSLNAGVIVAGCMVGWLQPLHWLQPILGVEWFTFWVALHLAASDLMPWWKRRFA